MRERDCVWEKERERQSESVCDRVREINATLQMNLNLTSRLECEQFKCSEFDHFADLLSLLQSLWLEKPSSKCHKQHTT